MSIEYVAAEDFTAIDPDDNEVSFRQGEAVPADHPILDVARDKFERSVSPEARRALEGRVANGQVSYEAGAADPQDGWKHVP